MLPLTESAIDWPVALKTGSGAEMVEQIGVGAADLRPRRPSASRPAALVEQKLPRRAKRGGAAFFGEASASLLTHVS